jgi:hypothetical protein
MPYSTTGSNTELQAVNQILASVGQAPVNSLTTEETFVLEKTDSFVGSISGTTLTTEEANIPVVAQGTTPETYQYTVNISQTVASTTTLKSVLSYKVETQTNPDVAIAYNTLLEVSREIQSEGWSFNRERNYTGLQPGTANKIQIPNNVIQADLSQDYAANLGRNVVNRGGYLYDTIKHTDVWHTDVWNTTETIYLDILWEWEYTYIPQPIQDYIVARAAAVFCSRTIGDTNQYQMLQQREAYTRAMALEYECNQNDLTIFGSPKDGNYYRSYQPFNALHR